MISTQYMKLDIDSNCFNATHVQAKISLHKYCIGLVSYCVKKNEIKQILCNIQKWFKCLF